MWWCSVTKVHYSQEKRKEEKIVETERGQQESLARK
jgi:hypothetical protein